MSGRVRRWLILHVPTWLHPHLRSLQYATTIFLGRVWRWLPGSSRRFGPPRHMALALDEYAAQHPACAEYRELYPSHPIARSLPKTADLQMHPEFYRERTRVALPAGIAIIRNGRVLTATGAVIGPPDTFIADVSETSLTDDPAAHPIFLSPKLPPLTRFDGTVAVLTTYFSTIYYHWLIDAVPRLHLIKKAGLSFDKLVVPVQARYHRECLALLGIAPECIVPSENLHVEADQLIVPSLPGLIGNAQGWACQFLRDSFLPHLPRDAGIQKRVYVSRARSGTRRFVNEAELQVVLERFGFETVFLEELPFLEQVRLFNGAEMVVAAHGSGLTNLVFCRPGTTVVEIFSPNYMNVMYWALSNQLRLDYHYLRGKDRRGLSLERGRRVHEDILVDVSQVTRLLTEIEGRGAEPLRAAASLA